MNLNFIDKYAHYILIFSLALMAGIAIDKLYTLSQYVLQPDMATLTKWALRFLEGFKMSEGFYDTNPPLSILLYIPVALAYHLSLPLQLSLIIYTTSVLGASCVLINALLKRSPWVDQHSRIALIAMFIFANIVNTVFLFGQRDQFLIMGLAPLSLYLLLSTHRIHIPKYLGAIALIAGSIAILLKPHYALVPATLLVHRIYIQKNIRVCVHPDFIIMGCVAAAYFAFICIFFHDFLTVMLPDITTFYATVINAKLYMDATSFFILGFFALLLTHLTFRHAVPMLYYLGWGICLSTLSLLLQAKGFNYHYIPANTFLLCFIALFLYEFLKKTFPPNVNKNILTSLTLCLALFISTGMKPQMVERAKETNINATPLAKIINDCPLEKEACGFFLFHDAIDMQNELSLYTRQEVATRFPAMWFMDYTLVQYLKNPDAPELKKYTKFILDDLKRVHPYTLIIADYPIFRNKSSLMTPQTKHLQRASFVEFFTLYSPEFKNFMRDYSHEKTIILDRTDFIGLTLEAGNILTYDIYRRTDNTIETQEETHEPVTK